MATNEKIIKTVLSEMPSEHSERLEGKNGAEILNVFENYETTANSFIKTLTNKVTKTIIYSKVFENPLKELKKGKLDYGDTIEELFVQMATVKGFTAHWDDNAQTPEADLIRKLVPKVSALYIKVNVDYKSKATVFNKDLRKAFLNEGGLQRLVMQIVGSITSAMEFKEFNLTKSTVNSLVAEGKTISKVSDIGAIETVAINTGVGNTPIAQTPYIVNVENSMLKLSKEIRETVGFMKFPSTKYNLAKQTVWSNPSDMVLITTPTVIAELDTSVLASAFNVSKAELVTRTIIVDEMPDGIFKGAQNELTDKTPQEIGESETISKDATKKPIAILMDKDLTQIWDTHQGAGTFYNAEGEYTNHFANREGIFATCLFANMAVFY